MMITLRAFAIFAIIVGSTQPAVPVAAFTEPAPHPGRAHGVPERCPYRFASDMPAATFCVYQGIAFGSGGEVCATDVVVIWSSLASQAAVSDAHAEKAASNRQVYLAFVADPDLVLHANVDPRQGDRAEVVGYTLGRNEAPQPLAGQMTLRAVPLGSPDVLNMDLREPRFHSGSCALASYSGTFLGMLHPRSETAINPVLVPPR